MKLYACLYQKLLFIALLTLLFTSACGGPVTTPSSATPLPTTTPTLSTPERPGNCGDAICGGPETPANCPTDCPATAVASPTAAAQADVTLTLGEVTGDIRPLLGVNVGPLAAGEPGNADLTMLYQAIGVSAIRTHDYYGPLDMATMYPDQNADPADPTSYDFTASDRLFRAIIENGFEPYLRLGDSWNNGSGFPPADPRQPTNPLNWTRAAVEVVRHYNDPTLWGDHRLRYVEVWNEPNHQQFWDGNAIDFYSLFADTVVELKTAFPDLRVGGPGLAPAAALSPQGQRYMQDLLDYLLFRATPLDFFSWHLYSNDPAEYAAAARFYREQLDSHGYTATESHITEWNTGAENVSPDEALALRTGARGAAILTAAWITLQDESVAQSYFYRGNDTSPDLPTFYGLFFADGRPKKIALAFALWNEVSRYPQRLTLTLAPANQGLYALAGQNSQGDLVILIANPTDTARTWQLAFADGRALDRYTGTIQTVSDAAETTIATTFSTAPALLAPYSVMLVTLAQR